MRIFDSVRKTDQQTVRRLWLTGSPWQPLSPTSPGSPWNITTKSNSEIRQRNRETDRQTDRLSNTGTDRYKDRQTFSSLGPSAYSLIPFCPGIPGGPRLPWRPNIADDDDSDGDGDDDSDGDGDGDGDGILQVRNVWKSVLYHKCLFTLQSECELTGDATFYEFITWKLALALGLNPDRLAHPLSLGTWYYWTGTLLTLKKKKKSIIRTEWSQTEVTWTSGLQTGLLVEFHWY